jgi:hypothetical protein
VLQGVGIGTLAAGDCTSPPIACADTDTCECLTGALTVLGPSITSTFTKGSLTFELSLDESGASLPISTAGSCFPGTGSGTLASSNGKITLSIDISGLVCPTADGTAHVFNGTYTATSGSGGKNPAMSGTGAINGSLTGAVSRADFDTLKRPISML